MEDIIARASEACGGLNKLSEAIGQTPQVVSNWRVRGIPVPQCAAIEIACTGAVRRWEMRPDDWHRIWPELIGADGAPSIPTEQPQEVRNAA